MLLELTVEWWRAFDAYVESRDRPPTDAELIRAYHARQAGLSPSAALLSPPTPEPDE